jgi:hypothetical protein
MSDALRKKLDRYANHRGPELTDREIGILYDSLSNLLGVLGEKIDAGIRNLQDERYEISERISDLEDAWSEYDYDFLRSEGLLSEKDLNFIVDFQSSYQMG